MTDIKHSVVKVTTAGSAGSATGTGQTSEVISGEILAIVLDFHASAPNTTDVTIATKNAPIYTIFSRADSVADGTFAPAFSVVTTANAAITNSNRPIPVSDIVTVALAQCDALTDAVVATIFWR